MSDRSRRQAPTPADDIDKVSPVKPRAGTRGSYAVGIEKRKRIIDVATEEFAANGYRGASLAKIAERVGLTQAGVLHHFRSKQELLVAVLEHRDGADAETVGLAEPEGAIGSGVEALHRLVRLMEANAQRRGVIQLFTVMVGESVTDDHPAHDWARARYELVRGSIERSLERGKVDGTIRLEVDSTAVASSVVAVMDGLQIQWLLDGKIDLAERFRRYVEDLVLDLVVPQD